MQYYVKKLCIEHVLLLLLLLLLLIIILLASVLLHLGTMDLSRNNGFVNVLV
jgi:hypothetical protein